MIAVGHTAVGVMVGVAASHILPTNPPLLITVVASAVAGLASHYLMDLVPHGHYDFDFSNPSPREKLRLSADLLLPIVLALGVVAWRHGASSEFWLVAAGIGGAQLPDIVNGVRARGWLPQWSWLEAEGRFHMSTHWHNPHDSQAATREGGRKLGVSDLWQLVMVIMAGSLLLFF